MFFPLFFLYFFQYADGGVYVIKVTINDGEGGVATTTSMITGVMLIDGVLQIVGTDDDDHVTINKVGKSKLRVHADFLPGRKTFVDFRLSDVTRIDVWLCDGDDHYNGGGDNATKGTGHMLVAFHEFVSWTWEKCEVVRLAGVERRDWHSAAGETEQQIARILTPQILAPRSPNQRKSETPSPSTTESFV